MAEPESLVLVLLRDMRAELEAEREARVALERRFDYLRAAVNGESVLGRYAAAEVDEALTELRRRVDALEKRP